MTREVNELIDLLYEADDIFAEDGFYPIFNGMEMQLLEEILAEKSSDNEGFWRSWSDESAPKFVEDRFYEVQRQNGWFCFGRIR